MSDSRFTLLPFEIFPDDNLITVKATGDLHFEDLIGHVPEFMEHPDFRSGMNVLYDLCAVNAIDGDLSILLDSAESLNCEQYIPVPARTVFLIKANAQIKAFLEGFCIMTRFSRVPHFVAESQDEAIQLLEAQQIVY